MKKISKIIALSIMGLLVFGIFSQAVLAKNFSGVNKSFKEKYQAARQQYFKEVNFLKNVRHKLSTAREKYRVFKTKQNKATYESRAREFLDKTIDVLVKRLDSLKSWISNRTGISESSRQDIISKIDNDISWLENQKQSVENASSSEIAKSAGMIRKHWTKHRSLVKRVIGEIWCERLNWIIAKFENVSASISQKVEQLKAAGKDTSKVESLLSDMNAKIENAKQKRDAARDKFDSITDVDIFQANQLFKEAHQLILEANGYIRQAHRFLVEIVQELKKEAETSAINPGIGAANEGDNTTTENNATTEEATGTNSE